MSISGVDERFWWHVRYPQRWERELHALDQTGWRYRVSVGPGGIGPVRLLVYFPLHDGETVRLRVRLKQSYPWFPPEVYDVDAAFDGARHGEPGGGSLCLIHDADWSPHLTVAHMLAQQMPKLIAANWHPAFRAGTEWVEEPVPEPVGLAVVSAEPAVVVGNFLVPSDVEQGALWCRFDLSGARVGAGVVEEVLASGFRWSSDLSARDRAMFELPVPGRFIRDRDFQSGDSAERTWARIASKLRPLEIEVEGHNPGTAPVELVGLLVPDEVRYQGSPSESWVFLMRVSGSPHLGADGPRLGAGHEWRVSYRPTQYLSRELLAERVPAASALSEKSVVVVGLGSIGMPLALDLAATGVGRLTCLDGDSVDVATGTRQSAMLIDAGVPKASIAEALLKAAAPYCEVRGWEGRLELLWDLPHARGSFARSVRDELASADLVIDATANPSATRMLGSLRHQVSRPLLVASAKAGAWGGTVALLVGGRDACWGCVEYARADGGTPVPPADDADGLFAPTRCAERTFRGTRSSLQQIAMHASSVAVSSMTGEPMFGNYWTASMRDSSGRPGPISWISTAVAVHPACPLHSNAGDAGTGAA